LFSKDPPPRDIIVVASFSEDGVMGCSWTNSQAEELAAGSSKIFLNVTLREDKCNKRSVEFRMLGNEQFSLKNRKYFQVKASSKDNPLLTC